MNLAFVSLERDLIVLSLCVPWDIGWGLGGSYCFVDLFSLLFREAVQWVRVLGTMGCVCRGCGRGLLHLLGGFGAIEVALGVS